MSKTIVVVDDDPTQRRLIQAVLEREGFAATLLGSGDALLDRMATGAPCDLILLDLVMPGRSGLETLTELRSRGHQHPVIVLTASGGIDTVVPAMQAGASDFFVKPASPSPSTTRSQSGRCGPRSPSCESGQRGGPPSQTWSATPRR